MADYTSSYSGSEIDAAIAKAVTLPAINVGDALKGLRVNAAENGYEFVTSLFPAGTSMLFNQATPPTGWTKKSDWADNASLIVGNTYIAPAGTDSPISWTTAIGDHSVHTHTGPNHAHTYTGVVAHTHSIYTELSLNGSAGVGFDMPRWPTGTYSGEDRQTGSTGDASGTTASEGTANTGPGGPTTHTQDTYTPIYTIVIAASKD